MEFNSQHFGVQHIDPETIITFPQGIPGFEQQKRYKLFHQAGSKKVYWLQSLDDAELVFSVTGAVHFNVDYHFALNAAEQALLKLQRQEDLLILILLHKTDTQQLGQPTIKGSLKAPLLINSVDCIGMQKILSDAEVSITAAEPSDALAAAIA